MMGVSDSVTEMKRVEKTAVNIDENINYFDQLTYFFFVFIGCTQNNCGCLGKICSNLHAPKIQNFRLYSCVFYNMTVYFII